MISWLHSHQHPHEDAQDTGQVCGAETDLMQHTHITCTLLRGHRGNHRATVTGADLHLARDGHTIRATAWQVEWLDDGSRAA